MECASEAVLDVECQYPGNLFRNLKSHCVTPGRHWESRPYLSLAARQATVSEPRAHRAISGQFDAKRRGGCGLWDGDSFYRRASGAVGARSIVYLTFIHLRYIALWNTITVSVGQLIFKISSEGVSPTIIGRLVVAA